ncbi:hypothetical protein HA402_005417 [Bradysia odoriphaga]|nr:hypothetical protein HA402_005417 [Bradysia odoriphaga]
MANQFNNIESFDEIDVAMLQLDTNVFVVAGENNFHAENEIDYIMSQIDLDPLYESEKIVDGDDDADLICQMEEEEDPEVVSDLPLELLQEYEKAMNSILPKRSTDRYMQAYDVFRNWQKSHRTKSFDKIIIMAYLSEASAKYKPTTLWSIYSMLKKTLLVKHNVDLKAYCRVRAFLKAYSDGYERKKSLVFTPEELRDFIVDAPDVSYLAAKVITTKINSNVTDDGKEISVHIPLTMTKTIEQKDYIICGEMAKIILEYLKLRPKNVKTERLLMQYWKGKCVNQVMGKHSIANIPKQIATFLKLP